MILKKMILYTKRKIKLIILTVLNISYNEIIALIGQKMKAYRVVVTTMNCGEKNLSIDASERW